MKKNLIISCVIFLLTLTNVSNISSGTPKSPCTFFGEVLLSDDYWEFFLCDMRLNAIPYQCLQHQMDLGWGYIAVYDCFDPSNHQCTSNLEPCGIDRIDIIIRYHN